MYFKDITIIDKDLEVREHMHVMTDGEKISYVGDEAPADTEGQEVYDGKGRLLMAGFVNSHAHSPMTLMRGYGEGLALQEWLNDRIFPFEAKLSSDAVYYGTLLAMAESIRYGIVSTNDMYYFCDDMAKAVIDAGCKNNISRSITNFADDDLWTMASAKEMKSFYDNFNGAADGKIKVDMSLHAEYTTTEKTVRELAEYTKEIGANMHVHVSETKKEHEECKERHGGKTPVKYLSDLGLFDTRTTAAHCVWVEPEDMDILKEKNVSVASNPISNLKLASGVCNVPELLRRGINVTIGTDSVSSNNSLNFIEEMKAFAIASKMMYSDPTAVSPKQTAAAATVNGAKAQGRNDCGVLDKGYRADLAVIDVSGPNMHPVHDMLNNLVYSASGSDVCMTMCDGKVLYRDGEFTTIDIEKTIFETEQETKKILSSL